MSLKIFLNAIVKRRQELPFTDLDGEVGLMNIDTGKYYGLDPVGSRIWELLENAMEVKDIINTLLEEYDVDEKTCEEHVLELLGNMLREELVLSL